MKKKPEEIVSMIAKTMFAECCMQFSTAIVAAAKQKDTIKPIHVSNGLYGSLGAIVSGITDDVWTQMMDVKPCGNPDCNCHVDMTAFMKSMDEFRVRIKAFLADRRGEQTHEM